MRDSGDERPVVVGYDGSKPSERALRWAVEEARLRFVPLVVCHAWQWPYKTPPTSPDSLEAVRRMGQHVLDRGVSLARGLAPRLEVRPRLETGSPSVVLMGESGVADLVVVGRRGSGGFEELQIGSTAVQLAAHAYCPVAVVKEQFRPRVDLVVVGVDGAAPERPELGLAFEEARLRKAPLRAICLGTEDTVGDGDIREVAAHFHRAVAVWEEKYPEVTVETLVEEVSLVAALQHAAEEADVVIIGDRYRSDPVELPLGLVCQAVLRGAPSTVMVVASHRSATSSR
ncbi:universal stress protein [Streptosporangium carneum]|uniref:Universal stress protein n=1 Tax=Streptosporangium carneum TaxID=47481 RepID=A0A9W6I3N5_9ACTN|nr:universal stress protein [Streptosporangium carneum]GLK11477.1 universal stress protein [Streptosporangium carneum]